MTSAKRMYFAVAGGLVALGIVLAGLGFVASGFNPAVFSAQIDLRDNTVILGGTRVDDPTGLPLIGQLASLGKVNVAAPGAPTAPKAPNAS